MKSPHRPLNHRRQRGQTILWFLATAAACCCALALVYNVGQVANKKEATVNAADATALSGALVEARMLNFEAYTNRAMIANEVTIAQMVSLDSWVQYDDKFAQWIAIYSSFVPGLDEATAAVAGIADEVYSVIDGVVRVPIALAEASNELLWGARQVANSVAPIAAHEIATQIASANATTEMENFDAAQLLLQNSNLNQWNSFTSDYNDDQRANAKQVILNSRDQFSWVRGNGALIDDVVNPALEIFGITTEFFVGYPGVQKTSGTATLQGYDHWEAQDSLDPTFASTKYCKFLFISLPCGFNSPSVIPVSLPIAYGGADADADGTYGTDQCNYRPTTTNCTMAVNNASVIDWEGTNGKGIPNIIDLAQGLSTINPCSTNNASDGPSLSYVAAVQKAGAATQTTQLLNMNNVDEPGPQGSAQMTDQLQNDSLTSISAACTFFLRPDLSTKDISQGNLARADGVHEYASLYNPYWQSRLTQPDAESTTLLYALIGRPGLNLATP